jgi:D-aminopeptidase
MINTTLVVCATDATFSRSDLSRLAVRAHDALGACIRPSHTRFDGDVVFVASCGARLADLDLAAEAAFVAVGRAIEASVAASAS